jgi:hypothetical protein
MSVPRFGLMSETSSDVTKQTSEWTVEEVSAAAVDCGYRLHLEFGLGLLEGV